LNKRKIITAITLATLISTGVWAQQAVELWNGFTTGMNRVQVEARARTIFGESARLDIPEYPMLLLDNTFSLPNAEFSLCYGSMQSDTYIEAVFNFYNGRLFFIWILFNVDYDDFLSLARSNYGQPTRTLRDGSFRTYYEWALQNRTVLLTTRTPQLTVFDKRVQENFIREQEEARRRERESSAERIQF